MRYFFRHLRGTDRRKAVKRFLDMACRIQLYGVDIHNVLVEGQDWVIGVDSRGILTFSRNQFERFTEGEFLNLNRALILLCA